MIITKAFIEAGKSYNGGWSDAQLRCLGEPGTKNNRGWLRRLIGKDISDTDANKFLELKDKHLGDSKKSIPCNISLNLTWSEQYKHPIWQKMRLLVFKRDSYMCRVCLDKNKQLHAHHLFYEGKYIWDVPMGAIITVCETCHEKIHKRKLK